MTDPIHRGGVPQLTLGHYEDDFADRHLLHGVVAKWAAETPHATALAFAETGARYTYAELDGLSTALALELLELGFQPGDHLATSLPMLAEHVLLEYACFKVGVVHTPLDLRLKPPEVIRSLELVRAKGFVFADPSLCATVREACPFLRLPLWLGPAGAEIEGATALAPFFERARAADPASSPLWPRYLEATGAVTEGTGAQVIYTTGSTGHPKPALLSHRNITCQNMCLAAAFGMDADARMLVHLPPSHVGCQTQQLMTTLFAGGTAVVLHMFDAEKTLRTVQESRVTMLGQVPSMFAMQWQLPGYADWDLSSLQLVICAGQQVTAAFAGRLTAAFPRVATGLGLTEMAGFVTYTDSGAGAEELARNVGHAMPVTPLAIRAPMNADGTAGQELEDGEVGEICFSGPQVFVGYVNDPEAYRRTVSTEGICYTGDLGRRTPGGLEFKGRSKLVIKQKGYQVHPAQVEDWFARLADRVGACGAVGAPHELFGEGIVLFVERGGAAELSREDLEEHARGVASYERPAHYVVLEPGSLPLNRMGKTDYVALKRSAADEVERLRGSGGWDA